MRSCAGISSESMKVIDWYLEIINMWERDREREKINRNDDMIKRIPEKSWTKEELAEATGGNQELGPISQPAFCYEEKLYKLKKF